MKLILTLILFFGILWAQPSLKDYKQEVSQDLIEFNQMTNYFGIVEASEAHRKFLYRILEASSIQELDAIVLVYLDYKYKMQEVLAMKYYQLTQEQIPFKKSLKD